MPDDLPRLMVVQVGSPGTPRFAIHDQFGRFWTGQRFEVSRAAACFYGSRKEAVVVAQNFVRQHYEGKPRTSFSAPVFLEVWSEKQVSARDVSYWCSRATCLTLDSRSHGNGPDGSLILPKISWSDLHEVKS